MTRTALAIATALLSATTLFGSAAQACISCAYTPEVVNTPVPGARTKSYEKKQIQVVTPRVAKKRAPKIESAASEPVEKKVEPKKADTAEAAPVETPATSTSATGAKAISTASLLDQGHGTPTDETAPAVTEDKAKDVGCKKFVSAIGATVTVPCE